MTRDSKDAHSDPSGDRSSAGGGKCVSFKRGYRWTCPYCDKSRTNASGGESGMESAVAALRSHIQASDGAEHGARNELPSEGDVVDLAEHVVFVDGRRDTTVCR